MNNEKPTGSTQNGPTQNGPASEEQKLDNAASQFGQEPANEDAGNGDADGGAADRVAALEAEIQELKDQHLRDLAEMENVRRRAQRDREDAAKFGASNMARDLLSVADNLRRALESVPAESRDDTVTANLLTGVELVERELLRAFEKHGIQRIDPKPGDRFDHNVHQAMFELENTGQPPGSIANVMQAGYVMHGRLLRAAMVGVAKASEGEPRRVDTVA